MNFLNQIGKFGMGPFALGDPTKGGLNGPMSPLGLQGGLLKGNGTPLQNAGENAGKLGIKMALMAAMGGM